jgi:two-component system, chemotaxis family, protein-glutamate methylesterase/glutaminase
MTLAAVQSQANSGPRPAPKIKVMIVEDSAVIRGLLSRWLNAEGDIEVVGVANDGQQGVQRAAEVTPDVVLLDIEMPIMDGLTALPGILKAAPKARVIMASTLTQRGGEVTIRALAAGASDYLAKPDAQMAGAGDYKRDLIYKVRMLGNRALRVSSPQSVQSIAGAGMGNSQSASQRAPIAAPQPSGILRPVNLRVRPQAIFIGASTGGPEALKAVISALVGRIDTPVFITQHMPPLFTKILAGHLSKQTGATVVEAEQDCRAKPGVFYIAPGDRHMVVMPNSTGLRIELNDEDHENFCRPAVDPLFRSAAKALGDKALAIVLTGMGHDGREGAKALVAKGANVITQDEDTSVVWGMPGAVTRAGLASASKPLDEIAPAILNILRGFAP